MIREIKRVSKPGRRVYMGVKDMPQVRQGLGVSIVSTPRASCPMRRPAPPMSAAKSSAPCSEEGWMSRIGKKPVDLPGGVTATIVGPDRSR